MDAPIFFSTRAHLLLCTGPRCAGRGSSRVFAEAWQELEHRGIAYYRGGGSVRLTESGCLGACNHGPTLAAYHAAPDGSLAQAWYVGVDGRALLRIADALHRGEPPPTELRFDDLGRQISTATKP